MKVFYALQVTIVLALAVLVAAAPIVPPDSIQQGGDVIQYLWHQARTRSFVNVLPEQLQYGQGDWFSFLSQHGRELVEDFYRGDVRTRDNEAYATRLGKQKFLRAITFEERNRITYDPRNALPKQRLAMLLVEKYAEQKQIERAAQQAEAEKRANWGRTLSLSREEPGPSHF
ncbi:uncharacterized protein UTRI_03319_B [Ustilago trichophora]|uniref:Uncharacterized protein n=1 Tax=Ustilago trichophora TaxID=86804 RepID=A0A5C3E694_9BASI|nr:uncharacterized protein UTRI_03319_B [Ustilago trichophora]